MKQNSKYLILGIVGLLIIAGFLFMSKNGNKQNVQNKDNQAKVLEDAKSKSDSNTENNTASSSDNLVTTHKFADNHILNISKLDGAYFELADNLANSYDAQVVFDLQPVDMATEPFVFIIKKEQTKNRLARVKVNYTYPNDLTKYTAIVFSTQCYMLKPADFKEYTVKQNNNGQEKEIKAYVAVADKKCTFNTPKPYTQYMRFLAYEQNDYYVIYALTVKSPDYNAQKADDVLNLMKKIANSGAVVVE